MKYLLLVAAIFFGDGWIKNYIEEKDRADGNREIAGGRVTVTKHRNKGAALNFMEERPRLVIAAAGLAFSYVSALLAYFIMQGGGRLAKLGAAMLVGGGLSNLHDRVRRGYVVDYFTINYGKLRKVIFNLSDICIFAGGAFLAIGEALGHSRR